MAIALACMAAYILAGEVVGRNRIALITSVSVTSALLVPLGASFFSIVREARIEAEIRYELVHKPVTFQHVTLLSAQFHWYDAPVCAELESRAATTVSTSHVRDLEAFLTRRTSQRISLVLHVSHYDSVTN